MGALCSRHAHLDASYGSCATLHGDWRSPEQAADHLRRDNANRRAKALLAYADGMRVAAIHEGLAASLPEDADHWLRSARSQRARGRAALHAFPDLLAGLED